MTAPKSKKESIRPAKNGKGNADIIAASREGRIRDPVDVNGK